MIVVTPEGEQIPLGTLETAPTIGIIDRSRRVTDAFGVTTVVERGFSRRMSLRLAVPVDDVDQVQRRLAELRATSSTWIADDRFQSLSLKGFYKDFSIDLTTPAIAYCSLTIESLTATDPGTDAGGDPSPDDQPSTLQLLQPIAITGASLVASSVTEADHPEWAAGTGYGVGARVIKAATHRIYESAIDANVGHDPAAGGSQWVDVGPTNRWAMFDQALGTSTIASDAVVVTIDGAIGAVALLDVSADAVRVQADGYDRTQPAGAGAITFLDLPAGTARVTVTITGGQVAIGTLLAGPLVALGSTETAPSVGITDYSRKDADNFGDVTVVERAWAKRMTTRALIRTDALDTVAGRISAVRARPSLWIGQAGADALTIYGFFSDFSIEAGETLSKLSLSIEGLSKAAPLPKPITSFVGQGSADGITWHLGLEPGDLFLRVSNDSGKTFGDAVRVAGRDAFTAYLTNSNHTVPALFDGTVTSYAGAESIFVVGLAGQDLTDSGQFDLSIAANPQNLAVVITGRHFRVTGGLDAGEDSATLTMRLTGTGQFAGVVLDQVFGLNKSKGGADGSAPALITLSASALTARYDTAGALVPGQAITFGARRQNTSARTLFTLRNAAGTAVHGPYESGDFARLGGTAFWSAYDPDTITLTEAGILAVIRDHGGATGRVTMVASIEGTALADAVSLQKVQDGARGADGTSPYNAILSNESHTLPADAAGNVTSYAGAEFTVTIFYGSTDVTGSFELEGSDNPQGLAGEALYPRFTVTSGFDAGEASASVTYRFIGRQGTPHAGVRVSKVFSLAKSIGGAGGAPAALISLSASALTARYDTTGALVPGQAITFGARRQNTSARTLFTLRNAAGTAVHGPYEPGDFARLGGTAFWSAYDPDTITLTEAGIVAVIRDHGGATGRVTMIASIEGTALTDAVSVQKVQDGARGADGTSPYNAILSNESHTLPADAAGNITSYAGAEFTLTVFYGSQDVTGSFDLEGSDNPQGLAGPYQYPRFTIASGFDAGEPTATVTYHFIGRAGTPHAGVRLVKVFSLAKSIGGAGGAAAPLITLTASSLTLRAGTDGNFIGGQRIDFNAARVAMPGPTRFLLKNVDGSGIYAATAAEYAANFPSDWGSDGPDNLYLRPQGAVGNMNAHGGAAGRFSITAYVDGYAVSDTVSIQKVQDGARGADGTSPYNAILSNESHTLPANAAGNITSYAGAEFTLTVFYGSQDVTGSFDLEGADNPQGLAGPYQYPRFTITSGLDAGEPSASVTYRFIGRAGTPHAGVRLVKVFSLAKSIGGAGGAAAPLITLTASSLTLRAGTDGNFIGGQRIDFNAARVNMGGPTRFLLKNVDGSGIYAATAAEYAANFPSDWGSDGPDNLYLRPQGAVNNMNAHGGAAGRFSITAYVDGYAVSDTVSIQKVQDGAKGADSTVPGPPGKDSTVPGPKGRDAIVFRQDATPSNAIEGDTWVTVGTRVWRKFEGGQWVQILGDVASLMTISEAYIADLTVGTLKIANNAVSESIALTGQNVRVDANGTTGSVSGRVYSSGTGAARVEFKCLGNYFASQGGTTGGCYGSVIRIVNGAETEVLTGGVSRDGFINIWAIDFPPEGDVTYALRFRDYIASGQGGYYWNISQIQMGVMGFKK